ncbi:hypothetical protein OROGR_005012 [Orobanche gracilis]
MTSPRARERQPSDMELMKEKFAKLLLGEDMSGGGKGVSSALALSNAITNLAASAFGEQKRLEPMAAETKARWRKEIDWLLSVTDYIVEFVPSKQTSKDGVSMEIMATRQRNDLHMNIPALRKLDLMLLECLDNFKGQTEFYYTSKDDEDSKDGKNKREENKWWIPVPKVPPNGLSEVTRKWLQYQKDSVSQILKAAMAINAQVLAEMEIPENYIESLPKVMGSTPVGGQKLETASLPLGRGKTAYYPTPTPSDPTNAGYTEYNGRASLGDSIYKSITDDFFDPDYLFSTLDLSTEHKILDLKNRIEASVVIWKRKMHAKDIKSSWGSAVRFEKRELFEDRAETFLLILKHRFPGLPQSELDISKIQYNKLLKARLKRKTHRKKGRSPFKPSDGRSLPGARLGAPRCAFVLRLGGLRHASAARASPCASGNGSPNRLGAPFAFDNYDAEIHGDSDILSCNEVLSLSLQDVGHAILESYSRIIESLAFTVLSRIEDVMQADTLARNNAEQKKPTVKERTEKTPNAKEEPERLSCAETPTSKTLLDFMGWNLDREETDTKKDPQDDFEMKHLNKPDNIITNKKISYIERLQNLSGTRSPTERH